MNPARNDWIDGLRALSAMAVALFHLNMIPQPLPPGPAASAWHLLWQHGHWGVGIFYALGGYCLIPGWERSSGWRDYLRRRAGRIMPPYWGSLLLVTGLALVMKLVTGTNDVAALPREAGSILATLLLLTDPVTAVPRVNWVYWTLSCMLAFYLLAGTALLAGRRRTGALVALHGLLCATDLVFHPAPVGALFFIKHWPVFGMGAALALWSRHRRAAQLMLAVSLVHAVIVIGGGTDDTHYVLVGALTLIVLAGTKARRLPALLAPLVPLGRISYSLYLVHVPVGIYVLVRFMPASYHLAAAFIGWQLAWLGGTVAAAALFYRLAERPFMPAPVSPP